MSLLEEANQILNSLGLLVETGLFSDDAPDEYVVITPLSDEFEVFCDNLPHFETQEARISLFTKFNYIKLKNNIVKAFRGAGFEITGRRYLGHEDDTGYHHYGIDISKLFKLEE